MTVKQFPLYAGKKSEYQHNIGKTKTFISEQKVHKLNCLINNVFGEGEFGVSASKFYNTPQVIPLLHTCPISQAIRIFIRCNNI